MHAKLLRNDFEIADALWFGTSGTYVWRGVQRAHSNSQRVLPANQWSLNRGSHRRKSGVCSKAAWQGPPPRRVWARCSNVCVSRAVSNAGNGTDSSPRTSCITRGHGGAVSRAPSRRGVPPRRAARAGGELVSKVLVYKYMHTRKRSCCYGARRGGRRRGAVRAEIGSCGALLYLIWRQQRDHPRD